MGRNTKLSKQNLVNLKAFDETVVDLFLKGTISTLSRQKDIYLS